MNDIVALIPRVVAEIRAAWRFRWAGVAAAWSLCVLGWAVVAWWPDSYEASATVFVDTSSVLRPILTNQIVAPDVMGELTYVNQALLGREHLERTARENELDALAKTPIEFDRLLERLRRTINVDTRSIGGQAGNVLATISYRHPDRDKAIGVVATFVNSLVEGTLGGTRRGTDTASRFLDDRIVEYETRLQEAETALAEFKKQHADRLPGAEGGYFQRISAMREDLGKVEIQLRLVESKASRLREQLSSSSPVVPTGLVDTQPAPNSIDARIRDQQAELSKLLLTFTEKHPDVIAAREVLTQLIAQRAEQLRGVGIADATTELSSLEGNPVYQALQVALNETEVEMDTLRADIDVRAEKLQELQALADEVPEVEAELARLNRDYDVVYQQYQGLIKSRETQDLSEKATDTDEVDFRVINPPLAAYEPVAPNRLLLMSAVLVFALGVGGFICWLMNQMRPVFIDAGTLQEGTGIPVLGVVSRVFSRRQRIERNMQVLRFACAVGALGLLFAGCVGLEVVGPGVEILVGRAS